MTYERELTAALEAARRAAQYLLDEYALFQAIPNAPADLSTEADRASQEIILQHLLQQFPDDAFCAEEKTPTIAGRLGTGARQWIVDPIDGTRGFAQKNGEFSVMIAFVHEGCIAAGVVLEPAHERLTYAQRDGGCWRVDGSATPVRCVVSTTAELSHATLTQSRSRDPWRSRPALALQPKRIIETHSAGIKLALVARGEADVYVNTYAAFHDWDVCAGDILVAEAGGFVTGLAGDALRYGLSGAWQRQGLLASNGVLHNDAVDKMPLDR
jgi:3'(2'), 5'-bisphosphate nucleotidase